MPDPRTTPFWNAERDALWNSVAELAMRSLAAGTTGGELLLPEPVRQLVAWDVLNQAAVDYLHWYRLNTVTGISDTTAKRAIAAIDKWMEAGEPLPVLTARLESVFGAPRAKMIGTTEVTRLYARGNQMAWQASGVVAGNRWRTANDERVCPYCGPLEGLVTGLENYFGVPEDRLTPELRDMSWGGMIEVTAPPMHPNCRCWLTPVVTQESLQQELRRQLAQERPYEVRGEGSV